MQEFVDFEGADVAVWGVEGGEDCGGGFGQVGKILGGEFEEGKCGGYVGPGGVG